MFGENLLLLTEGVLDRVLSLELKNGAAYLTVKASYQISVLVIDRSGEAVRDEETWEESRRRERTALCPAVQKPYGDAAIPSVPCIPVQA